MTLELFRCVPFATKLTRKACGERHDVSKGGGRDGKHGLVVVGIERCSPCPVGAAHVLGEEPTTWGDGSPIEVTGAPSVPEPGRSRWTGSGELPSAPPAALPTSRSTILPPKPITEGSKPMPRPARKHTYNGKSLTAYAWADEPEAKAIGIGRQALLERLRSGWTIEDALTVPVGQRRAAKRDVDEQLEKMVRPEKQAAKLEDVAKRRTKKRIAKAPRSAFAEAAAITSPLRVVWYAAGVQGHEESSVEVWADTFQRAVDQ